MSIFTKIKEWFTSKETLIEEFLTPYEHDFLQRASALATQIEHNLGADGLDLAKQLLVAALESVGSGNFGAAIALAAPQLLAKIEGDITAEAKNAAYGALAIAQGELQAVAAVAVAPAWNAPGKVDTGLTVIRIAHTPPG